MEISNYRHKIEEEVKFHEVDMMSVCNNAVYLNYFEDGRVKYIQNLKKKYSLNSIMEGGSFFIMARNEVNYIEPALFDDKLNVYTRVEFIKNSSFGFKHIIENDATKKIITVGSGIFVHINLKTKKSIPLPQEFYDAVTDFEKQVNVVRNE
ncbi:MAG: acyl-CoA thioesterase [Bacteroidetes bacterium]|nr:acyl-CoA thioesterase [Bacteroidota bacterium]